MALGTRMLHNLMHSRTQSPSYARSTDGDEGLWPNPYQTGIWLATTKVIVLITYISFTMFLWFPVLDLARAPRRTARKKGSGYENELDESLHNPFSYPEPFLRAVNGARQGALAKSISNWHLIGYNEGYCSNNVYILLPCFYGIRFWIWPEPLVAPRVRRALGTRMNLMNHFTTHSRTQSPSYARSTERDKGLWPNPYQTGIWLATTKVIVLITYIFFYHVFMVSGFGFGQSPSSHRA